MPLLVCFCPASNGVSANEALREAIDRAGENLRVQLEDAAGLYLVTSAEVTRLYPVQGMHDESADALGKIPYTMEMFTAVGPSLPAGLMLLTARCSK